MRSMTEGLELRQKVTESKRQPLRRVPRQLPLHRGAGSAHLPALSSPPLCKGRCRRTAAEGLLQSHETTPQALPRQLPLHRGAESRTNPVGTGVPDCPHPRFPLFHRVFHIAFPPENPDFTAFSRVFHPKNKHFSTFVVHNSVEKHRKRNYTT